MKKNLILFVTVLSIIVTNAQESKPKDSIQKSTKNFIQLLDGSIYYFDQNIQLSKPLFGKPKLKVAEQEFLLNQILYYQNGTQFFASTYHIDGACTDFAERIDIGKINIYRNFQSFYHAAPAPTPGFGFGFGGGYSSTKEVLYYNKGEGLLKRMNYTNLAQDLAEKQESMILLQAYDKARTREVIWYVVGGVATLFGALTSGEKTGETTTQFNPETGSFETVDEYNFKPVNFGIAVAGLATITINYFVHRNKAKYLKQAVYEYNR